MQNNPLGANEVALILDGGTTNSRLWATQPSGHVVAETRAHVGARDGVGDPGRVADAVALMVADVSARCASLGFVPKVVVAGGMITSPTGMFMVPHVLGPATIEDLAAASRVERMPAVCALPLLFVPGVKFMHPPSDVLRAEDAASDMAHADLVRGEELLCLGLHSQGLMNQGGTVISLGSHWKRLDVNAHAALVASRSSLTGELLAAVSGSTILAESLPHPPPDALDHAWVQAGAQAARERGLARALYEIRLLAVTATTRPEHRYSYMWGAAFGADLPHLLPKEPVPVFVVGRESLCEVFARLARLRGASCTVLDAHTAEGAFRASCLRLLNLRGAEL
ncbi:MAG: 2-dehydro-3-deoxygalactonokinase [Deltaproteobacteria bacterium]|nr:2-dehydro-3-deoxygalactonokinase [Deltaproteobacteria bacterium]